jgi:hypothetical protein
VSSAAGGAVAALVVALLPACAFDQGGIGSRDGGGDDDTADAAPGQPDARRIDAMPTAPDATPSGAGVLISRRTVMAPVLDGDEAEWTGAAWAGYQIADSALFGWRHASYDDSASLQFASLHDDQYIYFFFDVNDDLIRVDSTALYEDDGITLYLDAAGDRDGPYGTDDHELVIDAEGTWDDFATNAAPVALSGSLADSTGGYHMELRLTKSSLGAGPSLPAVLGFDVGLGDDDGYGNSDSDCLGIWFLDAPPNCGGCCQQGPEPFCDTTTLGWLVLED